MTSPTSSLRARLRLCVALGVAAVLTVNAPRIVGADRQALAGEAAE